MGLRNAELHKIPYMAVVGEKESSAGTLSVRDYATKKQEEYKLGEFVKKAAKESEADC